MIIDCHGHYTTAPSALNRYRSALLARIEDPRLPFPELAEIDDVEIKTSISENQLRVMQQRGIDRVILSPQASNMGHHIDDVATAVAWAQASNDLVGRAVELFHGAFAGVCQLPQTPSGSIAECVAELRRCLQRPDFVGCNLNPDPSGGYWSAPPLTDRSWYPLYEVLVEFNCPAMIHVSGSRNPALDTLGAFYLNADTTVFMQLLGSALFTDFPRLRLVIPHGGGAIPYHWGRIAGLATRRGRPAMPGELLENVYFDTAVYHQAGIDLLVRVIPRQNILFASEMLGAVRGADPATGIDFDDTRHYVESGDLSPGERRAIYEDNVKRVYPRLREL